MDAPNNNDGFKPPFMLVSLSAPKQGVQHYKGLHYLAGRFIPNQVAESLGIVLPVYSKWRPFVKLSK